MGALVVVEAAKLGQGVGAMAVASRAGEGKKVAPRVRYGFVRAPRPRPWS